MKIYKNCNIYSKIKLKTKIEEHNKHVIIYKIDAQTETNTIGERMIVILFKERNII